MVPAFIVLVLADLVAVGEHLAGKKRKSKLLLNIQVETVVAFLQLLRTQRSTVGYAIHNVAVIGQSWGSHFKPSRSNTRRSSFHDLLPDRNPPSCSHAREPISRCKIAMV